MKKGQKVYWYHNGKEYSGVLERKTHIVAEVDANLFMKNKADFEDTYRVSWNITGMDMKSYSVPEDEIFLEPVKN